MLLSTDNVVIARFAGALYDMVLDYRTDNEVLAATATFGVSPFLNAIYTRDFSNTTTTNVANIIATNLGLTGDAATQAKQYIVGVLNGTAPEQRGAAIGNMLNLFAQMTTDATFGPAALAWEALVVNAVAYSQDPTSLKVLTDFQSAPVTNSSTGQNFTLTPGVDTLTGTTGNDTFVGTVSDIAVTPSTLNPGDSISGGGGADTLKVVFSGATAVANALAGVSLSGVANVTAQNASTAAVGMDFTAAQDVTTAAAWNSISSVSFKNLAAGAKAVASGSATVAGTTINFGMKVATGAVSVGVDAGVDGVNLVNTGGAATAAKISSTGAANGVSAADTFALTAGGATVKTLAVDAATNLKATLTAADFAATGADLTVAGAAAKVDLGAAGVFKTVDASGLTAGGLTITTGATLSSLVGGVGNDVVTLGAAPSSSATINLGAGNDTLKGAVVLPTAAVVDGGAGTDTIAAALINVGSAANIKNFEGLDVTGFNAPLDASLLTNSAISSLSFSGTAASAATAVIQNVAAAATVNVTGTLDQAAVQTANLGSLTLSQTGTPTLAVNFAASPSAAGATPAPGGWFSSIGTLKETGNTAVAINAGGNSFVVGDGIGAIQDTSNKLTTITITGDHAFTLGAVATDTSVAAAVVATKIQSSLTTIDGSAATGKLSITAGADTVPSVLNTVNYTGLTINGGSAADTISIFAKNGVVNGGAGDDTINVGINAVGSTSDVVTVSGGAGADTLVSTLAYGQVATATSSATNGNMEFFADAASKDVLKFATLANAAGGFGAKADVSAAATFDQAVFLADSAAANTATWFQYAGNTYVEQSGAAAGTADNLVIKITGLVDLSGAAVVTGANGTITLA